MFIFYFYYKKTKNSLKINVFNYHPFMSNFFINMCPFPIADGIIFKMVRR